MRWEATTSFGSEAPAHAGDVVGVVPPGPPTGPICPLHPTPRTAPRWSIPRSRYLETESSVTFRIKGPPRAWAPAIGASLSADCDDLDNSSRPSDHDDWGQLNYLRHRNAKVSRKMPR